MCFLVTALMASKSGHHLNNSDAALHSSGVDVTVKKIPTTIKIILQKDIFYSESTDLKINLLI
jgi:hypothetical protein